MTPTREELQAKIDELEKKRLLSGDFMEQMEIEGEIHSIKMEMGGIKPTDSSFECFGCGS